jgi:hypothetical protein
MTTIPDEIYIEFLRLLARNDCIFAAHLILDRSEAAGLTPEAWLKKVVEGELKRKERIQ